MKHKSLLLLGLCSSLAFGQNSITMNFNDCSGRLNNSGHFFSDQANSLATYKVGSLFDPTAIYQLNFSALMKDSANADRYALTNYEQSDFSWGPIASNYSDTTYLQRYNKIWRVNQAEIQNHIANLNTPGYIVDPDIMDWPGNGNVTNGEASNLAPYVDVNQNGTYDPDNGDYPSISGDIAYFLLLNDQRQRAVSAGVSATKTELHVMFYQYIGSAAMNTATFVNIKAYNRGSEVFTDFKLGMFTDFDLGNYNDDYMGTDLSRNLNYVYNADGFDEDAFGRVNYRANAPSLGIRSLNKPFQSNTILADFPTTNAGLVNAYKGLNFDGSPIMNGGSATQFMFTDTLNGGFNEVSLGNTVGDRKSFTTVSGGNFAPNHFKCFDFVIAYGNVNDTTTRFKDVNALMLASDELQAFYDDNLSCSEGFLSVNDSFELTSNVVVYPNPATDFVRIESEEQLIAVQLFGVDGKLVMSKECTSKLTELSVADVMAGNYLLYIHTKSGVIVQHLSK